MRIICPGCDSHYDLAADRIGADGQLVRCARCQSVWRATREHRPATATPAAAPPVRTPDRDEAGPRRPERGATPAWPPSVVDMEAARQRLRPRRAATAGRFRGTLALLAVGTLVLAGGLTTVSRRDAIARELPSAASLFDALGLRPATRGLVLRGVRSRLVTENGRTVLTVDGEIANLGTEPATVPALSAAVRDAAQVPLYTWASAPPTARLAGGETVAFHTRLAAPPAAGKDVRVSLVDEKER